MTLEEFLERIDEIMCGTSNAERACLEDLYEEVTKPHWISVNDELPNEDGMYIFLQSGIIYTAMYYKSIGLHRDITHWMPLPSVERLRETTKMIEKGGEE